MKRSLSRLFAAILSLATLISALSLPVFAESSVLTGEFLKKGINKLSVVNTDTVSIFYFSVDSNDKTGVYKVSSPDSDAVLSYWCGTIGYRRDCTEYSDYDAATNSFTFEVTHTETKYLIGVTGCPYPTVDIEYLGKDAENEIPKYKYSTPNISEPYELLLGKDGLLSYVDVTAHHTAVKASDGKYHLDSADGPLLLVSLSDHCPYINLEDYYSADAMECTVYGKNGEPQKIYDFSESYFEYYYYSDASYGVYPLTDGLMFMLKTMGEDKGWYDMDRELGYYIFGNTEVCEDCAWMFALCYVPETDGAQTPNGTKEAPYTLLCDAFNYTEIQLKYGKSVFYHIRSDTACEITLLCYTTQYSPLTSVQVNYGNKTYYPDSDGLIHFYIDSNTDIIEIRNTSSVYTLMGLAYVSSVYGGDGSEDSPYMLWRDGNSHTEYLSPGESFYCITDDPNGTYIRTYNYDTSDNFTSGTVIGYNGTETVCTSGFLALKMDWSCNKFEIRNDTDSEIKVTMSVYTKSTDKPVAPTGTEKLPYKILCDDYDFISYPIAAGERLYFKVNDADGTTLLALAQNEYSEIYEEISVNYNGEAFYSTMKGYFSLTLQSHADTFYIENPTDEDLTLMLYLSSSQTGWVSEGSYEKPFTVESIDGPSTFAISFPEGPSDLGHISYTAETDGTFTFTVQEEYCTAGWVYSVGNLDSGEYSEYFRYDDLEKTLSYSIYMKKGETAVVSFGTYDCVYPKNNPEGDIVFTLDFEKDISLLPGDVDGDGQISSKDANILKRMIAGVLIPTDEQKILCDVNGDGIINGVDTNILKRIIAGTYQ